MPDTMKKLNHTGGQHLMLVSGGGKHLCFLSSGNSMLSVGNSILCLQAIAEMGMIKAQGDREQAMSEAEWKQLSNLIENDRRERVSSMLLSADRLHVSRP